MRKFIPIAAIVIVALGIGYLLGTRSTPADAQEEGAPPAAFAAVPGEIGAQDVSGPYQVQEGWPKDISTVPGNEKWTWGAGQGVFAESPNRVYLLFRGGLPNLKEPELTRLPQIGPSLQFPVGGLPWRSATATALPGSGGTGQDPEEGMKNWLGSKPPYRQVGVDANWQYCLTVVDAEGNILETWTQWDKIFRRPHSVYVNPYDAEKNVWVVDDHMHAIYKFTNDGKTLLQTIGTPEVKGADATHFNRPTFMSWLPDSSFYVADGYNGTRVAKFDKDGKFLLDWGMKGEPGGNESRPNYMNNVHGVAVDPDAHKVFVNDRGNHRVQVFDENGKYLSEWKIGVRPSSLHLLHMGADKTIWTFDRNTQKMLKYDQEGNMYVAEVDAGRVQKFRPRAGANPAYLISKPIYSAWQ